MEQHDEANPTDYPLGRGYGHDYMRGGEVFGGYGYRDREDYTRTRDGTLPEVSDEELQALEAAASAERAARRAPLEGAAEGSADGVDGAGPVPHLEHTYGDTGSAWRHSRSYYVTQAQLQQRIYAVRPRGAGPYSDRVEVLRRGDDQLRDDVREVLHHDTWVAADRISVEVRDATVTLRGTLPSADEVRFARDDAWSVPGVREVVCEIEVAGGRDST
jgi:hypothetical protein